MPVAAAVGALPFALSWMTGIGGHQIAAAVLLAALTLGFARRDAWIKGLLAISIAFGAHSLLVIAAARVNPARTAPLIPGGEDYWQRQVTWIRTGHDPEYQLSAWVPAHLQLLGGTVLFSYTSMGGLTFYQGFYEVDLMNYYNGRLAAGSRSAPRAMVLGWHIWSILRGLGYLFITFEVISWSLSRMLGAALSTRGVRGLRWGMGLLFILADAAAKLLLMEPVRAGLEGVLR